jgi:hypothetical protein
MLSAYQAWLFQCSTLAAGTLPEAWANMSQLEQLLIAGNSLTGSKFMISSYNTIVDYRNGRPTKRFILYHTVNNLWTGLLCGGGSNYYHHALVEGGFLEWFACRTQIAI